jgi:DNA end-binding protein Ku
VERQSGEYDAADLADRYETPLRAMIDAKLKGDLMAALEKSLGQTTEERKPAPAKKGAAAAKVTPIKTPQAAAKRKRA